MNKEILTKIKKLLRLSKSSNPNEAELALQRAKQIAEKAGMEIHESMINEAGGAENIKADISHEDYKAKSSITREEIVACKIIKTYFNTNILLRHEGRKKVICFIGEKHNLEFSKYVFEFIVSTIRRLLREEEPICKASFIEGFCYGLAKKLNEEQERIKAENQEKSKTEEGRISVENNQIVLVNIQNQVTSYIKETFGNTTQHRSRGVSRGSTDDYYNGRDHGSKTNIRRAISA